MSACAVVAPRGTSPTATIRVACSHSPAWCLPPSMIARCRMADKQHMVPLTRDGLVRGDAVAVRLMTRGHDVPDGHDHCLRCGRAVWQIIESTKLGCTEVPR